MTTSNRISELQTKVTNAVTYTATGRQEVVNSCKELYELIEDDFYNKYGALAINDAYNDLTDGDFSEPFLCEKKKSKFELYSTIYIKNVLPKLNN